MIARSSRLRVVEPMDKDALERLHTGSLLARLKALRSLHERAEETDWSADEISATRGMIAFKSTDLWKSAMADVKAVLAGREHVERGGKEKRRQAAHAKKHR